MISNGNSSGDTNIFFSLFNYLVSFFIIGFWDFWLIILIFLLSVQHECIPQAILGMDILCQAKSGMGKTAVFVLATLQQIEPVDGQVGVFVVADQNWNLNDCFMLNLKQLRWLLCHLSFLFPFGESISLHLVFGGGYGPRYVYKPFKLLLVFFLLLVVVSSYLWWEHC